MMKVLAPFIDAGKIKVYSCDSVAGRAMVEQQGSPQHRQWLLNQFHQYVRHEVVPAVAPTARRQTSRWWPRARSIGAFHAVAAVCRFPDVFGKAIAMSGTFDLRRFFGTDHFVDDYWVSSHSHFVPGLSGPHLNAHPVHLAGLGRRQGRRHLGVVGDGPHAGGPAGAQPRRQLGQRNHTTDWVTWRSMLPKYVAEQVIPQMNHHSCCALDRGH